MAKLKRRQSAEITLSAPMLNLLQRAQERFLARRESTSSEVPPKNLMATEALVHELQVHQIELELQNEELRNSQLALAEGREDYFDLYDLAPVGYLTVTDNASILKANLTAAGMLGCTRRSLISKQLTRYIHKSDQDTFYLCQKASLNSPQAQSCELRMRKSTDTHFWSQAVMTFSKDRRGAPELRIILTDITLRKQADDERAQLLKLLQGHNADLAIAKTAVEDANRTQVTFLSNVTHELRTPLNAILGFSQLLDSGNPELTPSQKHRIDQISKAGWTLLEVVDKMIALAEASAAETLPKKSR